MEGLGVAPLENGSDDISLAGDDDYVPAEEANGPCAKVSEPTDLIGGRGKPRMQGALGYVREDENDHPTCYLLHDFS